MSVTESANEAAVAPKPAASITTACHHHARVKGGSEGDDEEDHEPYDQHDADGSEYGTP